jgi:hypothetical protein
MRYVFFFLLIITSSVIQAQQTQAWLSVNVPIRKGNWEWHNDAGYRNELNKLTTQQFLYRTGVRHYFNEKMSTALGYAFFDTKVQGVVSEFGPENRIWQEFNTQISLNKNTTFVHRVRTEERWFSKTSVGEAFFGFRTRYRAALQRKLTEQLDVQIYNELMYQYQRLDWVFNQNRIGLNFFIKAGKSAQFNVGYTYMTTAQSPLHLLLLGYSKR